MVKHLFSKVAINLVFLLLTNFVSSQVSVPVISKTQGELETYMFSDEVTTTQDLSSYLLATLFGEAITELGIKRVRNYMSKRNKWEKSISEGNVTYDLARGRTDATTLSSSDFAKSLVENIESL